MLKQPMIEKLAAMRFLGIVEALKTQEQNPAARLLVDPKGSWRVNQALGQ
jgi:hypothetical protein